VHEAVCSASDSEAALADAALHTPQHALSCKVPCLKVGMYTTAEHRANQQALQKNVYMLW
jgi:hypothetical protein